RRPPESAPFPYTTLVPIYGNTCRARARSDRVTRLLAGWLALVGCWLGLVALPAWADVPPECTPHVLSITAARAETPDVGRPVAGDRKSTRLNSSHVKISYA